MRKAGVLTWVHITRYSCMGAVCDVWASWLFMVAFGWVCGGGASVEAVKHVGISSKPNACLSWEAQAKRVLVVGDATCPATLHR